MKEISYFKKGVTLIEVLFVLGILAILLGIVMVLYSQSNARNKTIQATEEIEIIRNIMNNIMTTQDSINNFNISQVINSGQLPNRFISSDGKSIVSPYGTNMQMSNRGTGVQGFNIWFNGLTPKQCSDLVLNADPKNFYFVQVAWIQFGTRDPWMTPINPINIVGTCKYNQSNTVAFAFDSSFN